MRTITLSNLAILVGALSFNAFAEEKESIPNWKDDTITGDWVGLRTHLYQRGVDFQLSHKSDVLANVSGGVKRGAAWLGHTDFSATLHLDKLLGWDATTAYVHYHSDLGSKFNEHYIGGFMGVDNIEVATNTGQFYQAWLQKNFINDNVSLLAGLYAIDSEFYVTESSGLFIQPPYGMANDFAQAGANGPPVFPLGALAIRAKVTSPSKLFYAQTAITDGVPGDPDHPRGTHIKLGHGDGTLSVVEFGYTPLAAETAEGQEPSYYFNKTAIGFWRITQHSDDLTEVDAFDQAKRRHNQGVYFLSEQTLYLEQDHPSQGLAGFVRAGYASKDVNQADWTASIGLNYRGLIHGRDEDVAGIAMTYNHASTKYQRLNQANNAETDVELSYRIQVKSWLAVQPTLQYIANPSMDKTLRDVSIVGVRTEWVF